MRALPGTKSWRVLQSSDGLPAQTESHRNAESMPQMASVSKYTFKRKHSTQIQQLNLCCWAQCTASITPVQNAA